MPGSSLIVLLVVIVTLHTVEVNGLIDRSRWEWKLSDMYTGTLMMRPSPNHTWGTVCKDGMRGYSVGERVCRSLGFRYVNDWIIAPGPSDAPIYLDDASCEDTYTSPITTCNWSAGDASVLGVGTPGTDCSHAEDVGYICSIPEVDDINFRMVPLEGLPEGSMTGTVEMQMGQGQQWYRMLFTESSFSYENLGALEYLCGRIFPGRNFTSDQAQYIPSGVGNVSSSSSPTTPFIIDSFYFNYDRDWYIRSLDLSTPRQVLNLTCEAQIDVRLANGSNEFQGNAEVRTVILGGLYTPAYAYLCDSSSTRARLAMAVCGTKFGPGFTGYIPENYPFGSSSTTTGIKLEYYQVYDDYSNGVKGVRLGDTSPTVSLGKFSTCTNLLPVQCVDYESIDWEYNFKTSTTYSSYTTMKVVARRRGSGDAWSSLCSNINDAATIAALCTSFDLPYGNPTGVGALSGLDYISVRPLCSAGQDLNSCQTVTSYCISGEYNILCYAKYTPATTEYDNKTSYEFRLEGTNTTLNYTEGVVQMRGTATSPWRSQCVDSTLSSYKIAFASLLCRDMYPNQFTYGVSIDVPTSYQHPTVPPGQSVYSQGVTYCPTTMYTGYSQRSCNFQPILRPCSSIAIRCYFGNATLRLYNPTPDGRSGYLQVYAPGSGWGRVRYMQNYNSAAADRVCSDLGFPAAHGFPQTTFGTFEALGPHITDLPSDSVIGSTGTVWDFPHLMFFVYDSPGYVYISCVEPIPNFKVELRITGGTGPTTGILEARFNSTDSWGRVCAESSNSFNVIGITCRTVFGGRHTGSYGTQSPSTWSIPTLPTGDRVNGFNCRNYQDISTCFMYKTTGGSCDAIGLVCYVSEMSAVQLVGGSSPSNGVLQVRYDTSWRTVSNDYFKTDNRLWGAMCALAGYPTTTPLAYKMTSPRYRLDVNPTMSSLGVSSVLSSAACTAALIGGDATNISLVCFSRNSNYGMHQEDVGLDCMPTVTTSLSITNSPIPTATVSHSATPTSTASTTHTSTHIATLTSSQLITATPDTTVSKSITTSSLRTISQPRTLTVPTPTQGSYTASTTITYTPTTTPTLEATKSETLKFYCVNSTWPAIGRACDIVQGVYFKDPCATLPPTTIAFGDWFGEGRVHTFEVKLQHPMGVRKEALQTTNTTTSYRRVHPSYVAVEIGGGNVTASVYAKVSTTNETGVTLRVEVVRTLGWSETSAGLVASIGLLLSPSTDQGLFTCVLPNKGLPLTVPASLAQMRAAGLYVAIGASLLFDAPPPMTDPGTRKAVGVAASAATVASVAAGPMAADMQALAALGSIRCAPGGGDATGQNKDAVADNMEAMSIVALDGTCQGVLMGNVLALGGCMGLHVLAAVVVFVVKRAQGHTRFPFLQAMALVRLPSLLFVASSALQTGFVVCGYQLMIGDADVVLGAVGFVFGVVLLPVVPAMVAWTIMSRRRYAIEFPSFAISSPSLQQPMPPATPDPDNIEELDTPPNEGDTPTTQPRTILQSRAVTLFLPTSNLDTDFHPLSVAFSTFASRNRLPHAIWSSLPYLTPLALLPALMAPMVACLPLLVTSALLHLLLAAIVLVFRPHAILFSNFMGAAALLVNALLVICAAALTHDPGMEVARTVLNSIGGMQMMVSVARLLHVGVVSVALPVMMTLHMLPRPVRVDGTPSAPKKAIVGDDVEEEMLNAAERGDTGSPHQEEKDVVPLWTILGPCAPRWPPTWVGQLDGTEAANELGIGNNIIQDLLFAPDMAGPRPNGPPPGAYEPRGSISDDDIVERKNTVFEANQITPILSPSSSRSSSLDLGSEEGKRIEQLRDPAVNPMALMHSTAAGLSERTDKKKLQRRKSMTAAAASQPAFKRRHSSLYYLLESDSSSSSILLDNDGHPLPSRRQLDAK